eukprot:9472692-Pyramimonas_sp.AAC.1
MNYSKSCPTLPSSTRRRLELDTDTVELTVKTFSSHLITREFTHQFFTDIECPCRALAPPPRTHSSRSSHPPTFVSVTCHVCFPSRGVRNTTTASAYSASVSVLKSRRPLPSLTRTRSVPSQMAACRGTRQVLHCCPRPSHLTCGHLWSLAVTSEACLSAATEPYTTRPGI